jgi:hypothetical protein
VTRRFSGSHLSLTSGNPFLKNSQKETPTSHQGPDHEVPTPGDRGGNLGTSFDVFFSSVEAPELGTEGDPSFSSVQSSNATSLASSTH